eukprot:TRINITY_DN11782_c0_g1_i1.p1 TRINITY_DN11782_c0_g1~~TRINITY_DN11782_c0_g1_i1.p1  ORF type:complete len:693 (-),score=81.27 TRINITY_DN11782_c0_g1_i1:199-2277(-)
MRDSMDDQGTRAFNCMIPTRSKIWLSQEIVNAIAPETLFWMTSFCSENIAELLCAEIFILNTGLVRVWLLGGSVSFVHSFRGALHRTLTLHFVLRKTGVQEKVSEMSAPSEAPASGARPLLLALLKCDGLNYKIYGTATTVGEFRALVRAKVPSLSDDQFALHGFDPEHQQSFVIVDEDDLSGARRTGGHLELEAKRTTSAAADDVAAAMSSPRYSALAIDAIPRRGSRPAFSLPASAYADSGDYRRSDPANDTKTDADGLLVDVTIDPKHIGRGSFGTVYRGNWGRTVIALKEITSADRRFFAAELASVKRLKHPNVTQYLGLHQSAVGNQFICMEYMEMGSLLDLLKSPLPPYERQLLHVAVGVASGLVYLQTENVVHGDIAARNILCRKSQDDLLIAKLADFGFLRDVESTGNQRFPFNPKWAAPEIVRSLPALAPASAIGPRGNPTAAFTSMSDVFSFGMVLFECVTFGAQPFSNLSATDAGNEVLTGNMPDVPDWCNPELASLMKACWNADPNDRPCPAQLHDDLLRLFQTSSPTLEATSTQRTSRMGSFQASVECEAKPPGGYVRGSASLDRSTTRLSIQVELETDNLLGGPKATARVVGFNRKNGKEWERVSSEFGIGGKAPGRFITKQFNETEVLGRASEAKTAYMTIELTPTGHTCPFPPVDFGNVTRILSGLGLDGLRLNFK